MRSRAGLTLLETMVALVILGLIVLATVELLGGTIRVAQNAAVWSQAVSHAENGMELAKFDLADAPLRGVERLEGGFTRTITVRSWTPGVNVIEVAISLPDDRRFVLSRLVAAP